MALAPSILKFNQVAQDRITREEAARWFDEADTASKKKILEELSFVCYQAHPLKEEVDAAIQLAELKAGFTSCVLLKKAFAPERAFFRLPQLPEEEWKKSFLLLLALFSIADKRRRDTVCKNGCSHEWHHLPNA